MIRYFTTTEIWIHLEDYYNKGLEPEKAKEIIESIVNPFQGACYSSTDTLQCEPMRINRNWIVKTQTNNPERIREIVEIIEHEIKKFMGEKTFTKTHLT